MSRSKSTNSNNETAGQTRAEAALAQRLAEQNALHAIHMLTLANHDFAALASGGRAQAVEQSELDTLLTQSVEHIYSALRAITGARILLQVDASRHERGRSGSHQPLMSSPIRVMDAVRGALELHGDGYSDLISEDGVRSFLDAISAAIGTWIERREGIARLVVHEQAIASTQDQLAVIDRQLQLMVANQAYAEHVGVPLSELRGRQLLSLLRDPDEARETHEHV
ncbi:MAG: PAS domain-containing protein, partial [Lamprobacter sp.]|uniref:PAS domain-containing protein n=1 Tax=Lamprobacter sp. TaxID=3100796 RepID=UPI002B25E5B8